MDEEKEYLATLTKEDKRFYFLLKDLTQNGYFTYNKETETYTRTEKPMEIEIQNDLNEIFQEMKSKWPKLIDID